jgi:hypothetical protein
MAQLRLATPKKLDYLGEPWFSTLMENRLDENIPASLLRNPFPYRHVVLCLGSPTLTGPDL